MDKLYGIIYKVINKINGKIYIGKTIRELDTRKRCYESKARNNSNNMSIVRALRKYGNENFIWDTIEQCYDREELSEMEFHYIRQYKAFGGNGYNVTLGGEGSEGYKHTKEACETIRRQKIGVKLSAESIAKRSALQSYTWKIIYPDGKIEIIRNLSKFCRSNDLGLRPDTLGKVATGKRKQHKGFKCEKLSKRTKYISEEARHKISAKNLGRKLTADQIKARTKVQSKFWLIKLPTGEKLKVQNLKNYCRENGLSYSAMCRISRGKRKTHRGGYSCIKLGDRLSGGNISMCGTIYKVTNKINGKIYIGQTARGTEERKYHHIWNSSHNENNNHFHSALRKHGVENFEWETLDEHVNVEFLNKMEIYYIGYYDTYNNGYNSTLGGNNSPMSEETKKKLSIALSGKNHPMYGRSLSDEFKKKLSLDRQGKKNPFYGRKHSEGSKKKMSEASMGEKNPNYGKKMSPEIKQGLLEANIGRISPLRGTHLSDETKKKISIARIGKCSGKNSSCSVVVIIGDRRFDTRIEAAKFVGISPAGVRKRILHKTKWLDYHYADQVSINI